MVSNVSALGRNGVHEWLLIRTSAIIIFFYIIYLSGFILLADTLTYEVWRGLFVTPIMKVFTLLTCFSVLVHTWIGMWQVLTDYIHFLVFRLLLQLVISTVLIIYLLYVNVLLWDL